MVGGDWRLAVGGWWLAAVGGSWRQLAVGDGCLAAVDGWRLVMVGGWQNEKWLVVGGWWRLAVSGRWSLGAVLKGGPSQKKIWSLKDRPGSGYMTLLGPGNGQNGYINTMFSAAHKWAILPHDYCLLGAPQKKEAQLEVATTLLPSHQQRGHNHKWLHHPLPSYGPRIGQNG